MQKDDTFMTVNVILMSQMPYEATMIVYKSMISSSLSERKKEYPERSGVNRKSLIIVGFSAVLATAALLIS